MAMDEKGLGRRLQDVRRKAGFTQQELCQKADLSYSTLAKIERGAIKAPSIFTIKSLAEVMQISLDELMGLSVAPTLPQKKISNRGVKFVYFDVNDCLVKHQTFAPLSEKTGVPVDSFEAIFWDYNDPINRGERSVESLNNALSELAGVEVDWMEYYLDIVQPVDGMAELLSWVHEHYRVGLLTNTMPGFVEALQARGKIPPIQFDAVADSSVIGAMKPDPVIYEAAEQLAKVSGSEILYVDDLRSNLVGAKKCGWHTIWFDAYRPEETVKVIRRALEFSE